MQRVEELGRIKPESSPVKKKTQSSRGNRWREVKWSREFYSNPPALNRRSQNPEESQKSQSAGRVRGSSGEESQICKNISSDRCRMRKARGNQSISKKNEEQQRTSLKGESVGEGLSVAVDKKS